jgi:hypothetical protein
MKKLILTALIILPLFLNAQDKWEIAVFGYQNYGINTVIGTDNNGFRGGMFGGYYHFHIKRKIFFVTGFEFSQLGSQKREDFSQLPAENINGLYVRDPSLDDEFTYKQYYAQIPFELRIQFPQKKVVPFVQGGMVHSFLLGERYISKFAGKITNLSESTPLFDRNAVGLKCSLGFCLPLSNNGSLNIAACTYLGTEYFFRQYRYRALGIHLGYLFGRSQ